MSIDVTAVIQAAIPTGVGLGGFLWGIHTYRQGQNLKRKDILFSLIDEFDKSKKMDLAKKILDGFSYARMDGDIWVGWYNKTSLDVILRYHQKFIFDWDKVPGEHEGKLHNFLQEYFEIDWPKGAKAEQINNGRTIRLASAGKSAVFNLNGTGTGAEILLEPPAYPFALVVEKEKGILKLYTPGNITDAKEQEIRDSFSVLLDFFGKLGYLMNRGLVKREELQYFEYYINKAKDDAAVQKFADYYNFDLYKDLLRNL
ncbi:MAG: hypothetical protein DA330_03405 [Nitrososphaera sp.]|nr:hypothetical protein [Nitrososphaera sp.]